MPNRDTPPEPASQSSDQPSDQPPDESLSGGRPPESPHAPEVPGASELPHAPEVHLPAEHQPAAQDRASRKAELQRQMEALTPDQRQQLTRVNRLVLGFGLGALVAMIGLTLPLPWPVLGLVALAGSAALAIKGIALAHRTPLARGVVVYLSMGLALLAMFTLYSIPLLLTWGERWEYQQCLGQTQTIEGQDACTDQYEKATKSNWANLIDQLRG